MSYQRGSDERGFTLVEVLAATLVLVVGLLGTISLLDAANATTVKTRARENANNLAREVVENARVTDYDDLTSADVQGALQARPALDDSTPLTPAWTIERGNRTFTLTVTACTYDDAKDSVAATHDASFCSSSPAVTPATDVNPDDFRRVNLTITWPLPGATGQVSQTALIINPSGGLGPRIISFLPSTRKVTSGTTAQWTVSSSYAASVHWAADDATSEGDAANGPSAWNITWQLGAPLDPVNPYVRDGTYDVTAQAFDAVGIPGDLRVATLVLNRSDAVAPSGLRGGRNDHFSPPNGVVDLNWKPNLERDVIGYRVYDTIDGIAGNGDDRRVCPLAANAEISATFCTDANPPAGATSYYVQAFDLDNSPTPQTRAGAMSALLSVRASTSARPTFQAADVLTATLISGPQTRLTWPAATDSDGSVIFYRVYRDTGTGLNDRYDFTETSSPSYTDPSPGASTQHRYWVTAVDDSYNESAPLGPVDSP